MSETRTAAHAGSWYTSSKSELNSQLTNWLAKVPDDGNPVPGCKAIIAPHAGYSYSGPTAAWAYKAIDTTNIKRVFILGPSHHVYIPGCALSVCAKYATPIGDLPLDLRTIEKLRKTSKFNDFTVSDDEAEHSLEMHLPYVRKVFEGKDITIVPIVVGSINKEQEAEFGRLLAPYLAEPDTFFVISSDFCHWGTRFTYTYYYPEPLPSEKAGVRLSRSVAPVEGRPIHQSIRELDHQAIDILTLPGESKSAANAHSRFAQYLATTKNTICGRHPIGVLLGALTELEQKGKKGALEFVRYAQSSECVTLSDSSVSYASAWARV